MRRCRRGEAGLLGMLLLGILAAAALVAWHAAADAERRQARERGAGKAFAAWVLAADRASRRPAIVQRFQSGGNVGFALTFAELRALGVVPPGLPETVRGGAIGLGIVPERTGSGVPMAFGVLQPAAGGATAAPRWQAGAREGGLMAAMEAGDGRVAVHLGAIAAALGAAPVADTVFATADASARREEAVVYRHRMAGAPHLNRMESGLGFDAGGIAGAGTVFARTAAIVRDGRAKGGGTVDGSASAGGLRGDRLTAGNVGLTTGPLTVSADLVVGTARAGGAVSAGAVQATGLLSGGSVATAGTLTAGGPMAVDGTAGITGAVTVTGAVNGERIDVGTGTVTVSASVDAGSAYGPAASFDRMTVGSCDGCGFWLP